MCVGDAMDFAALIHFLTTRYVTYECDMKKIKWLCFPVSLLLFAAVTATFPAWWCGVGAGKWFDDPGQQVAFANAFEQQIKTDLTIGDFGTAADQYNGEWLFCTHVLGATGFAQMAIQHPEQKEHYVLEMEKCIDKLLEEDMQRFDEKLWGSKAMETLDSDTEHHGAYLAYLNFVLSLHRTLKPESRFADTNDLITETIVRRIEKSKLLLLQTYRNQIYPPDNCLAIASIGLHEQATNAGNAGVLEKIITNFRELCIDQESGLMIQAIGSTGRPYDEPRGSGTTFGLYFLSFVDSELAADLYQAAHRELASSVIGFGLMQEYPESSKGGIGDVDSGPVIMNFAVSPTGFMIAGTRIFGDRNYFKKLYRTSVLFGAPLKVKDKWQYVTGGPLGNAIMFAMLTAVPAEVLDVPAPRVKP